MRREICLQLNQAATNAWELAELTPVQVIQGVSAPSSAWCFLPGELLSSRSSKSQSGKA